MVEYAKMRHTSLISPDRCKVRFRDQMTDLLEGYDSHIPLVKDCQNPLGAAEYSGPFIETQRKT